MAVKIILEVLGIKSLSLHLFKLFVIVMYPLAACGYLKASEKQVGGELICSVW